MIQSPYSHLTIMIKKSFPKVKRPSTRIDRLRPAAQPGWYKRFKQLSLLAGNNFRLK